MGTSIGNKNRKMYTSSEFRKKLSDSHTLNRVFHEKFCLKCGEKFEVERTLSKEGKEIVRKYERSYCSRVCANSHGHDKERNKKISESLTTREIVSKICPFCKKEFKSLKGAKTKGNIFCSNECSVRFRYKDLDRTTKNYYRFLCRFDFSLSDYPEEFDFRILEECGMYRAKNHGDNLGGVSRDHLLSVDFGYKNNIDPKLMKHPANCALMRQSDNSKKHIKSSITYEELLQRIEYWDRKYPAVSTKGDIMSRKYFNDGAGDDAPRFIPVGVEPEDFIPVGREDEYVKTSSGWWKRSDWEKMRIK